MNISLVNCQSVCNKSDDIADYVEDLDLEALFITEMWLTPDGYTFRHALCTHQKGSGVGILYRDTLKTQHHPKYQARSFEHYQLTLTSGEKSVCFAIIYRLHPTSKI